MNLPMPMIVGVPRSGTTLLRFMLDGHPEVAIPPETGWLPSFTYLDDREDVFNKLSDCPQWQDFHLSKESMLRELHGIEPFNVPDGVRAFYRLYAARFNKSRWGDKTPDYSLAMEAIEQLLPEAHFIHVIRDGRDVAVSVRDLWFRPGETIEEIAQDWCRRVLATRHQNVGQLIELRYEDLVSQPEATLRGLCEFVHLPFDSSMLRYYERTPARLLEHEGRAGLLTKQQRLSQQRFTTRPPLRSRVGRWKAELSAQEIARFERVAGGLLAELGYR